MNKVTEEALDKLFDDKDATEMSESYHAYDIAYMEYLSRMNELYAKYGVEQFAPKGKSQYCIIKVLNRQLARKEITEADYDMFLKRTFKDIEEEVYYKDQQELSEKTT
ncbi:hypothetical protein ABEY52_19695 [Priestia aryabhattai]|uniref:hypothetical protein n=1 Tax=Priestia aryabhattai TaxID=412384 RepID=UPI003D2978FE